MASYSKMNDGYGVASFTVDSPNVHKDWLEIQVNPHRLKVTVLRPGGKSWPLVGEWFGPGAVAVGAAVCNGHLPPAILADFCDETAPNNADRDLCAGERLRKAV